jgi:hypothetical protein
MVPDDKGLEASRMFPTYCTDRPLKKFLTINPPKEVILEKQIIAGIP